MGDTDWVARLSKELPVRDTSGEPSRDFGGPLPGSRVEVATRTREELSSLLRFAGERGIPVACRGARHCSGGQTAVPLGISLLHRPEERGVELHGEEVEAPAHLPWHEVEAHLHRRGRDLLVATSSLETTVGGTLSLAGLGVRSVARGPHVDHVRWIDLITADGSVRRCSPTDNRELFAAALTGLGQVGVIDRVRLQTAPRREFLSLTHSEHDSFEDLASSFAWLEECDSTDVPDMFCALLKQGTLGAVFGSLHETLTAARQATRRRAPQRHKHQAMPTWAFEAEERDMPAWWEEGRNVWCDYCFAGPEFREFARFVDSELRATLEGHLGYVLCSKPKGPVQFALDIRPLGSKRCFTLGLFYSLRQADMEGLARARKAHALALRECLRLGGRPYLHGLWGGEQGLSGGQLQRFFGEGYARLRAERSHVDPQGILNRAALN